MMPKLSLGHFPGPQCLRARQQSLTPNSKFLGERLGGPAGTVTYGLAVWAHSAGLWGLGGKIGNQRPRRGVGIRAGFLEVVRLEHNDILGLEDL